MEKRANKYSLTLRMEQRTDGELVSDKQLELKFSNHDDLFEIMQRVQDKDPFDDKQQAMEMVLGFKMFREVILRNRKHPLFKELNTVFPTFIQKLKNL